MPVPNIPANYLCPITVQIMFDPFIAEDGCTYEREAIEKWFNNGHNTSPMGHGIIGSVLIPNRDKKFDIMQFLDNHANFIHEAIKSSTPGDDNLEFINALIKRNKANLDRQDAAGQTPLHTAVIYRKLNIIQLLLQAGADYKIRNNQHKTPKREAKDHEFWDIVNTIELEIKSISLTKLAKTHPQIDEFSQKQDIPNQIEIMQYETRTRDSIVELEETARNQIKTELDVARLTQQMQQLSVSRQPQRYLRLFTWEVMELLALGTVVIGASAITYQYKKLNEQSKTSKQQQNQLTKLQWEQQSHSQDISDIDSSQRQMLAWKKTVDVELENTKTGLIKLESTSKNLLILQELQVNVAYGRQKKAEIMLSQNPGLALMSGDIIDCAGRHFKQITVFQYAIWALDWHMWTMISKYLPEEEIRKQIAGLSNGVWIKNYGTQASWQNLIDALQQYIDNWSSWNAEQCEAHWIKQVGGSQLYLPAHVINEYHDHGGTSSHLRKTNLQRIGVNTWFYAGWGGQLGEDFAWAGRVVRAEGTAGKLTARIGTGNPRDGKGGFTGLIDDIREDSMFLRELFSLRAEQARAFIFKPVLNKKQRLNI